MKELKTMLTRFNLNPIILHEKASIGLTLGEIAERVGQSEKKVFKALRSCLRKV